MPMIPITVQNFPAAGAVQNGRSNLPVSWAKLVWSAVSVGKASRADIAQHGRFSLFEIAYRSAMIYANLKASTDGYFDRSSAYEGLDPSEKGAISYFLGIALTKVFASEVLGVPWLMHVDLYRQRFGLTLPPSGNR